LSKNEHENVHWFIGYQRTYVEFHWFIYRQSTSRFIGLLIVKIRQVSLVY